MNFNGSSINITAKIDLEKIVYPDQDRNIMLKFEKTVLCGTCNGEREAAGS